MNIYAALCAGIAKAKTNVVCVIFTVLLCCPHMCVLLHVFIGCLSQMTWPYVFPNELRSVSMSFMSPHWLLAGLVRNAFEYFSLQLNAVKLCLIQSPETKATTILTIN